MRSYILADKCGYYDRLRKEPQCSNVATLLFKKIGDPNKPIYMFTDGRTGTDQKSYLAKHEDIENYVPEQGVYLNRED
jgi:hypothetical protein